MYNNYSKSPENVRGGASQIFPSQYSQVDRAQGHDTVQLYPYTQSVQYSTVYQLTRPLNQTAEQQSARAGTGTRRSGTKRCVHFAERGNEAQDAPLEILARLLDIDHRVRAQPARKQKTHEPENEKRDRHIDVADVRVGS